jgi:hypothetical protein
LPPVASVSISSRPGVNSDGGRQRLGEDDPALEVVDVVVESVAQVDDARHEPGVLVTHLDPNAIGADQQVLTAQEVQRSARAAELVPARYGARVGGEAVEQQALLAEAGGSEGLVVEVGAVEPPVDLGQLVVQVVDLEVPPQSVALVLAQLEIELAQRRCRLIDAAVVSECRVEVVGVDAPQQRFG